MINFKKVSYRCLLLTIVLACMLSCGDPGDSGERDITQENGTTAAQSAPEARGRVIIEEATAAAGLENMAEAAFAFRFRDKEYRYQRTNGRYTYERWWTDSTTNQVIRDVLDNDGLVRYVDGQVAELTDKNRKAYANSVNSVIYFAFLPWALNDPAVIPTYLGRDTIRGELLDQVKIAFTKENGGDDAEDEYLYWFTPDTRQLKYLAYSEPGGKIPRFREAYNERRVDGITIRDYRNYNTPGNEPRFIRELSQAFGAGELNLLSEINLEEVRKLEIREGRQNGNAVPEE